jgi:hypothetical protein
MTFMYERQRFHKTALTETQSGKMQEAVTKAEHTIQQRLADCPAPIMLRGQCSSDRRSPAVRPNCPFRWFSVRSGLFLAIGKTRTSLWIGPALAGIGTSTKVSGVPLKVNFLTLALTWPWDHQLSEFSYP